MLTTVVYVLAGIGTVILLSLGILIVILQNGVDRVRFQTRLARWSLRGIQATFRDDAQKGSGFGREARLDVLGLLVAMTQAQGPLLKSLLHHEAGAATRLLTSDLLALHDIHVAHQHHDERPVFDAAATNLLLGESTQADLTLFLSDPGTSSRISDSDVYGGYALSLLSFAATARWVSPDSTFAGWWNSERAARLFEYGMQAKRFEELCTILSGFHEAGHDFREAHFDVLKKLLGETTPFQLRARLLQLYFSLYPEKFGQHLEYTTEAFTIALEHENLTLILPSVDATVSRRLLLHYFPQRPRIVEALNVWFGSQSSKNRNPDLWVYYLLAQSAEHAPPTREATA